MVWRKMIIMRGLPGSGKSHYIERMFMGLNSVYPVVMVVSADHYFTRPDETYDYNPRLIKEAHAWALKRLRNQIEFKVGNGDKQLYVVDNTHTRLWEARPYVELAMEFDMRVDFHYPDTEWANDPKECMWKGEHDVGPFTMKRMAERFVPEVECTVETVLASKAPWEE